MDTSGRRSGILSYIPWRGLLVLALLLGVVRYTCCTVLKVPTGSMEPTFHGDPAHGDEVLVCKPWFHLFSPKRFDPVVFRRKGDDVRTEDRIAVKRIAALGGESVRVDDGDLWVTPPGGDERRLVKRYSEFRSLLVPLWREPFDARSDARLSGDANDGVTRGQGWIELANEGEGSSTQLVLQSNAVRFDDGWVDEHNLSHPGRDRIRDVLFELEVELSEPNLVLDFQFTIGSDELTFSLIPKAPGHALEFSRKPDVGAEFEDATRFRQVSPDTKHRLEYWQVDGNVGFAVDGRVEYDAPLPGASKTISLRPDVGNVSVTIRHGRLKLTRFDVWRDLHYTEPADATYAKGDAFEVPPGDVFVLGDCSFDSVDSRHFGSIPVADLLGAPLFVVGPKPRWHWLQ